MHGRLGYRSFADVGSDGQRGSSFRGTRTRRVVIVTFVR